MDRRTLLLAPLASLAPRRLETVRIGLATDVHHADRDARGLRQYRAARGRMEAAVAAFTERRTDLVVELGDFIDEAPDAEREQGYAREIDAVLRRAPGQVHHVLGNHCVWTLTKKQFLEAVASERSYYSFARGGWHFVVLDACFRLDGVEYGRRDFDWRDTAIPPRELEWLEGDLKRAAGPVVVFVHQRIDVEGDVGVKNGAEARRILESSGKLRAVFQGHSHENDLKEHKEVPYVTFCALVDHPEPQGGAWAVAELKPDGAIALEGFRRQQSRALAPIRTAP
jgi:alkaline phosphatase